ncbi:MAG: ABC transporter permease subunit [Christensenella sp.]|uniref:ABC transporter permease n=1 Tax=Christensenella sp. TaxID=1935934 RepID=UPI002B202C82|nr:ABC transporter permease subunit [Christensenella sp.]MEA5002526.1 ABC transporter permease subunit [Christensenella sp.]
MRKGLFPIFRLICGGATLLSVLFIGGNVAVIAFRGASSLPECLFDGETLFAVGLSVRTASISSLLCFALAIPTAYTLTRTRIPCRPAVEVILELTLSLPYIVLGLSLLIIFASPLGKAIKAGGFPVVFSPNGIVIAQLAVNLPFAIKLAVTAFKGVDRKLERVAGLLGATPGRCFLTVLLPLCRNALISAFILVWSRALGEFGATLMLVGVTRMKTETLPASIYLNVSTGDLGTALASAFILLVISVLSLTLANVLTRSGVGRLRYDEH